MNRFRKLIMGLVWLSASTWGMAQQPNIILFMTDDMGMECLGVYGAETYKTPVLDQMAAEGMRFEHCYSQPLCTPSRDQDHDRSL
ncbi:sulfatase-like hydrolase/transferase [Rubritalea tangerina]|uniref:Sulfatase-like hydrolase/transferase n=1 Tax=Rubritalea tangerina TaxID=430798 RepID=A0ABW4Z8Z6_9BACT